MTVAVEVGDLDGVDVGDAVHGVAVTVLVAVVDSLAVAVAVPVRVALGLFV